MKAVVYDSVGIMPVYVVSNNIMNCIYIHLYINIVLCANIYYIELYRYAWLPRDCHTNC